MRHEVTQRDAVAQLSSWWRNPNWVPEVREVAGPPCSGRTGVLRGLSQEIPDAIVIDATGRTAEELCEAIKERSQEEQADRGALVLLLNVHRAGRTRRSSHPRRIIESRLDELAESHGLGIVVEINDEEDFLSVDRPRYVLDPPEVERSKGARSAPSPEILALALAEARTVPLAVWRVLATTVTSRTWDEAGLEEIASQHPALEVSDRGTVTFADESLADALRSTVSDEVAERAHRGVVTWLLDTAALMHDTAAEENPAPATTADYTARAIAMHAVNAGDFRRLLRHGTALALLSQDALLDAASCLRRGAPVDTLASDAFYAHSYGVRPGHQGEWAAWLHLFATSRGERRIAQDIASVSWHSLPWRCRWTHWRPPGSWQPHFIEPGPVAGLAHALWRDRPVILGWGEFRDAVRPIWMWDAATGELLAPHFDTVVPDEILAAMAWHDGRDEELTFKNLANEAARSYGKGPDRVWLPCALHVGDSLVVAGPGGVFAVDPVGTRSTCAQLDPTREEDQVWPYRSVTGPPPAELLAPEHNACQRVFAPDVVARILPERLPAGLRDTTTRRVLLEVGLPLGEVGGLELSLPDVGELPTSAPWRDGEQPDDAEGPFFHIGQWWGGAVVIDGATGMVLRAQAQDEPEDWSPDKVTASDLLSFVAMLQLRKLASHFMAMAPRDPEQRELRYQLEEGLEGIDERGAESPAWMRGLLGDSVW
ncbi:SUKH-4 family immunity protein [Streptomyces sp. NPDC017993]|uniref:SUKH-4 family immunity protein n=1 Tax=Streptomyces sp. NPDC017993 TaxID=3365027 RepID=UPI0037B16CC4